MLILKYLFILYYIYIIFILTHILFLASSEVGIPASTAIRVQKVSAKCGEIYFCASLSPMPKGFWLNFWLSKKNSVEQKGNTYEKTSNFRGEVTLW
jgi:hypothetical protein